MASLFFPCRARDLHTHTYNHVLCVYILYNLQVIILWLIKVSREQQQLRTFSYGEHWIRNYTKMTIEVSFFAKKKKTNSQRNIIVILDHHRLWNISTIVDRLF